MANLLFLPIHKRSFAERQCFQTKCGHSFSFVGPCLTGGGFCIDKIVTLQFIFFSYLSKNMHPHSFFCSNIICSMCMCVYLRCFCAENTPCRSTVHRARTRRLWGCERGAFISVFCYFLSQL